MAPPPSELTAEGWRLYEADIDSEGDLHEPWVRWAVDNAALLMAKVDKFAAREQDVRALAEELRREADAYAEQAQTGKLTTVGEQLCSVKVATIRDLIDRLESIIGRAT